MPFNDCSLASASSFKSNKLTGTLWLIVWLRFYLGLDVIVLIKSPKVRVSMSVSTASTALLTMIDPRGYVFDHRRFFDMVWVMISEAASEALRADESDGSLSL